MTIASENGSDSRMSDSIGIKDMSVYKPLKSCRYCGDEFYSMDARQLYCCPNCRNFMCLYRKDPIGRQEHRDIYQASTYQEAIAAGIQKFIDRMKL